MSLFDWIAATAGSWLILAALGGTSWVLIARRVNPTPEPEVVHWIPVLPPVPYPTSPPLSQTVPAADWFYDIPVDVLSNDAVRLLCDDIARREFS